jgi:hypothetical protein
VSNLALESPILGNIAIKERLGGGKFGEGIWWLVIYLKQFVQYSKDFGMQQQL